MGNVKPLFSDKKVYNDNTTLADKGHIISEDGKIAGCFIDFFVNAVKEICIDFDNRYMKSDHIGDPVINVIENYKDHPIVRKIEDEHDNRAVFSSSFISLQQMITEIQKINASKSCPINSIPCKIIKSNTDFFAPLLYNNFNNCIFSCMFLNDLKLADISPRIKIVIE